jgi:hypothetical protein
MEKEANRCFRNVPLNHSFMRYLDLSCFIKYCYRIFSLSEEEGLKGENLDFERDEKKKSLHFSPRALSAFLLPPFCLRRAGREFKQTEKMKAGNENIKLSHY